MNADFYINHLGLLPHPEGGFYRETYKSGEWVEQQGLPGRFGGKRVFSTAIYYLLPSGDFSAFHRIKSDECWHFYAGQRLLIHVIESTGNYFCVRLGNDLEQSDIFQFVVPAGAWFAAEPANGSHFSLAGCTVAPGFDFADFEMANKEKLLYQFPAYESLIKRLCK